MASNTAALPERLACIPVDQVHVEGALALPADAIGIVLFAHGSGSSRHSPRNNYVAHVLHAHRLGTLLLDLLTPEEDLDYSQRFDIPLLARRLLAATRWLQAQQQTAALPLAYFGASTGAAAALQAAAELGHGIRALVSRGGRPDLAGAQALARVQCPTLLIVGGRDSEVLELNRQAEALLRCPCRLEVVPGATHLFEEAGALETVAQLAAGWLRQQLPGRAN
jgi:putative phosphoribosyl transferase